MINSRKLDDLSASARALAVHFIALCHARGVDILVTSTFRDAEAQDLLYARGRTTPGPIVTNAKGGDSFHQYQCAFDCYPMVQGKPLWNVFASDGIMLPEWNTMKLVANECGLEWAGTWKHMREYAHFQFTNGHTLEQYKKGDI